MRTYYHFCEESLENVFSVRDETFLMNATNLSIPQLMELHINTLYCCDVEGRMRAVNEAGEPPAPRFYMGRTKQGNFWRFRHDLPAALVDQLDQLCRAEPITSDLATPPKMYAAIHRVLNQRGDEPHEYRGPA